MVLVLNKNIPIPTVVFYFLKFMCHQIQMNQYTIYTQYNIHTSLLSPVWRQLWLLLFTCKNGIQCFWVGQWIYEKAANKILLLPFSLFCATKFLSLYFANVKFGWEKKRKKNFCISSSVFFCSEFTLLISPSFCLENIHK